MNRLVRITGEEIPELQWKFGVIVEEKVVIQTPSGATILTKKIKVSCENEEKIVYGYQISWKPV